MDSSKRKKKKTDWRKTLYKKYTQEYEWIRSNYEVTRFH